MGPTMRIATWAGPVGRCTSSQRRAALVVRGQLLHSAAFCPFTNTWQSLALGFTSRAGLESGSSADTVARSQMILGPWVGMRSGAEAVSSAGARIGRGGFAARRRAPIEPGMPVPPILVIAPPPIGTPRGPIAPKFTDAGAKGAGLATALREVAQSLGCPYFDAAGAASVSQADGIHFDEDQHRALGLALADAVCALPLIDHESAPARMSGRRGGLAAALAGSSLPMLRRLPPEAAHDLGLAGLQLLRTVWPAPGVPASLAVACMGLKFAHPLGLAAGFDKNGDYLDALGALGFSHVELGTVTPRPQPGNPKPRMFRSRAAMRWSIGWASTTAGVEHLVARLQRARYRGIRGISIGKNADTPIERALEDYLYCMRKAYALRRLHRRQRVLSQHGAAARAAGCRTGCSGSWDRCSMRARRSRRAMASGCRCWSRSPPTSTPRRLPRWPPPFAPSA